MELISRIARMDPQLAEDLLRLLNELELAQRTSTKPGRSGDQEIIQRPIERQK